jgi:hypothetical protein
MASLRKANLYGADLQGANLQGANLRRAILADAVLDKNIASPTGNWLRSGVNRIEKMALGLLGRHAGQKERAGGESRHAGTAPTPPH